MLVALAILLGTTGIFVIPFFVIMGHDILFLCCYFGIVISFAILNGFTEHHGIW